MIFREERLTMKMTRERLAAMIDHTFLKAAGEADAVEKLCREAKRYHFACAMVNPCEVRAAVKLMGRRGGRVGTVVNFPLGQGSAFDLSDHTGDEMFTWVKSERRSLLLPP